MLWLWTLAGIPRLWHIASPSSPKERIRGPLATRTMLRMTTSRLVSLRGTQLDLNISPLTCKDGNTAQKTPAVHDSPTQVLADDTNQDKMRAFILVFKPLRLFVSECAATMQTNHDCEGSCDSSLHAPLCLVLRRRTSRTTGPPQCGR